MYPIKLRPPKKSSPSRRKPIFASVLIVVVLAIYSAVTIAQPFTTLKPVVDQTSLSVTTQPSSLPWPGYGAGAFGLINGEVVATNGEQRQVAIASAAKVITALIIMERHPMGATSNGPIITMTANDVAIYRHYVSIQGSVVPVAQGQRLTQRQMLEAILLPSANNIADSLAIWSFGSVDAYLKFANKWLSENNLTNTIVGDDASGYSSASKSTPSELVKIGAMAMRDPALAGIVGQKTALIPGVGTVKNYNSLLGTANIVGVKTGNNDDNLGVFIGAAKVSVNGKSTTVISALSGAPNLGRVLRDSGTLLAAAPANFATTTVIKKDSVLGNYRQEDGSMLRAIAASDVNVVTLRGTTVSANVALRPIVVTAKVGQNVGQASVQASEFSGAQSTKILLRDIPNTPSIMQRLLHR